MNWKEEMALRYQAAERNACRELVQVESGSDWQIRNLQETYPDYLWKYSEGHTVPSYVLTIASKLENEHRYSERIPTDLYPCEYFRIMENSMPTDIFLQPKRLDGVKVQLAKRMEEYYNDPSHESELRISDNHLIPKIACAARIDGKWYRGRLENAPAQVPWLYVNLVDFGMFRQVSRGELRYLDVSFGHYPPLIVRATIRGALNRRMDIEKVERFVALIKDLEYMTRCKIISSTEPFEVIMCHPTKDSLNICDFLVAAPPGEPSSDGSWLPQKIARELDQENGVDTREDDDSGADSDLEDDDEWQGWDFDRDDYHFVRSYPRTRKIQHMDSDLYVVKVETEQLIYLASGNQKRKRIEAEKTLADMYEANRFPLLPDAWHVFGAACVTRHEGILKRAAIVGIRGSELDLALVDYGTSTKAHASNVFSLPQEGLTAEEPFLCLVSMYAFPFIHYSRVQMLREILPPGTRVTFNHHRRSKDIPIKGNILLPDGTSVEDVVFEQIAAQRLDLDCLALVPYKPISPFLAERVNKNFVYKSLNSVIYKKSKLVTSQF